MANPHLAGTKLVLTGDFDAHERDDATRLLEALGADVTGTVSGKTMAVIVGKNAGATKLGQAEKRGLPLLNEAHLLELIAGKTLAEVLGAPTATTATATTTTTTTTTAADEAAPAKKAKAKKATAAKPETTAAAPAPTTTVKKKATTKQTTAAAAPARFTTPLPLPPPRPRDGVWVEHFPGSDRVRVSGAYRDGLQHGSWKVFHDNGQLAEDYGWERGLKQGAELDWTPAGVQICEGQNARGKRIGTWTWSHPNGARNFAFHYDEQARRSGPYEQDDENGQPLARGAYVDDGHQGHWTWWRQPEHEKLERGYDRGAHHGVETAWFPGGQLAFQRGWHRGAKHGDEEVFDKAGQPTFKGQWRFGHPVSEHITWSGGEAQRSKFVDGLPVGVVDDQKVRDQVLKKLKKAKDAYAKRDAITDAGVEYAHRAAYLRHLWRDGHVDVGADHELWETFAEAAGLMSGDDVARFLKEATAKGAHSEVLPGWGRELDVLVMQVYARDPAPIDAVAASLPKPLQRGLAFVRARFGHDIGNALHDALSDVVDLFVEHNTFDETSWPDAEGNVRRQKLFSDYRGTRTPLFDQVVAWLGGEERWLAELAKRARAEAAETVARVSFRTYRDVVTAATPEEAARLIGGVALGADTQEVVHLALHEWRKDDAATTARIAIAIDDTGLRKWPAVATAILRFVEEKKPVPDALVDALPLADEAPTYTSSWQTEPLRFLDDAQKKLPAYRVAWLDPVVGHASPRTAPLQRAMAGLTEPQRRRVIERHLASAYEKRSVAQYLHLVDDPALWERFLDVAAADSYGHTDATMYGVGEIGAGVVPLLIARHAAAKGEKLEGYSKALLVALARTVVDTGTFGPELDEHVRFDSIADESAFRTYAPFVERILSKLPQERAAAILLRGLSSTKGFTRAFRSLALAPTAEVLTLAFRQLLAVANKLKHEQQQDVASGIASLPNARDLVGWLLRQGVSGLGDSLKSAIGWQAYEEIEKALAAAGAPPLAEVDDVEKLRLRAADVSGKKGERIYVLRKLSGDHAAAKAADDAADVNVIGGPAPGIDASRWPSHDDEPMVHLFTLDVRTMPGLEKRFGADVRAVSVFCWHPSFNEAFASGSGQTAIVTTTEAQLTAGGEPPEEAELADRRHFAPVAIDVSPTVWSAKNELRDDIYRAHARVLGEPLWLQGDEDAGGTFVMQFDDGFVDVNLGDSGIMYVFDDDAFWQCH